MLDENSNDFLKYGLRLKEFNLQLFNKPAESFENTTSDATIFWNPNNNNNKSYTIYDNILSKKEIKKINSFCKDYQWQYRQSSISPSTKNSCLTHDDLKKGYENHWNKNLISIFFKLDCMYNKYLYTLFYDNILPKLDCIEDKNLIITRAYFNSHTLGFPGSFHKDGKPLVNTRHNKIQYTVLLFINNDWNINFNGETAFILNDNLIDDIVYIHSKPGRIVVFSSHISHKACEISPYSLQTNKLRFVFAYHLYYPNYII